MSVLARRGFTLLELVVALALLAIVAAGIGQVLLTTQRTYRAQTQRLDLQQNLRAVLTILPPELRELDAADSDITAMSATAITIRAMRQLAFLCVAPLLGEHGPLSLVVRRQPFFGARQSFAVGESVLVFYEGDPASRTDDGWRRGEVTALSSEDCPDPDHTRPGYRVVVRPQGTNGRAFDAPGAITKGSPLRGFAVVTYALYRSPADNEWYLGQQLVSGTMQPLVGPLIGPTGLTFGYYDSTGAATAMPTAVREIEIRVRARTALPIRAANARGVAYEVDSVVTRVALRNNPRCGPCP